ncbi:MAG: SHOCT domain-containing protein [Armatimonadetes bacterium]|nr:SHOCT domain-containing protein [Armatimonadota bacterium]
MEPVYTMKGVGELLEVYEDKIDITPKGVLGLLSKGINGTKSIPIVCITGIQFKKSGLTSGYLQFTIPGGNESRRGVLAAASDENTFMFAGQNELALKIKEYIEAQMKRLRTPQGSHPLSLAEELTRLAEMRERGLLSDDEFQRAKARLLS